MSMCNEAYEHIVEVLTTDPKFNLLDDNQKEEEIERIVSFGPLTSQQKEQLTAALKLTCIV